MIHLAFGKFHLRYFSSCFCAINASQIEINFNQAITESDVISSGTLQNVIITPVTVSGVASSAPGTLTPELSKDGKKLTLTTASGSKFEGKYTVKIEKDTVHNLFGEAIAEYSSSFTLKDVARPTLKTVTYSLDGETAYMTFSEPVADIDPEFLVTSITRKDGKALNASTTTNFTASDFTNSATDRNVIKVDLTDVNTADENTNIDVKLVGLKDNAGNLVTPNPVTATIIKDTQVVPQAKVVSVQRTALDTVEVVFDREIKTAGTIKLDGTFSVNAATVDASNPKKVTLELDATEKAYTGLVDVELNGWEGYKTSGAVSTPVTKIVNFTVETVKPTIVSSTKTTINDNEFLVLTLSEEVTKADLAAGTFTGSVSKANGDLENVTYNFAAPTFYNQPSTATASKTIKIDLETLTDNQTVPAAATLEVGTYNVDISAGIAKDLYGNPSVKKAVTFSYDVATEKLSAPASVASKTGNANVVEVKFNEKIDVASAQNVANYSIEGVTISSAKVVANSSTGATIELAVAQNTVTHEGVRVVTVKNIKGFGDSLLPMNNYSANLSFKENVAPRLETSDAVVLTSTSSIVVDFNEALVDADVGKDFEVFQNGVKIASTSSLSGTDASKVNITLTDAVTSTTGLVVKAASTIDLTDANFNKVVFSDTVVTTN